MQGLSCGEPGRRGQQHLPSSTSPKRRHSKQRKGFLKGGVERRQVAEPHQVVKRVEQCGKFLGWDVRAVEGVNRCQPRRGQVSWEISEHPLPRPLRKRVVLQPPCGRHAHQASPLKPLSEPSVLEASGQGPLLHALSGPEPRRPQAEGRPWAPGSLELGLQGRSQLAVSESASRLRGLGG